ncbi:MAG: complex I NDUFA9 subunit family protein [Burkholderiales bacterium]|nr:complex I NDUFA9 subunit family protein [Burkholderiales bacterium]
MNDIERDLDIEHKHHSLLVIGGSGFIGSHLVAALAAREYRVLVPTRRYERAKHLLVLPTVYITEADVHDPVELQRLMKDVDAVINLVGILHDKPGLPYGPGFAKAHVELPKKIVAACAAAGVSRYLHMSALGADKNGPSMYQRSKADGESAAKSNPALGVTIFRPSVVFGEGDRFLNLFATLQKIFPLIFLGNADAKFQPVYAGDVAQAFVHALEHARSIGKAYELAGPKVYTLRELVELAGQYSGHVRRIIALPSGLARLQAWFLEHMPGEPLMSRDNLDSMKADNILRHPFDPELGLSPTPLEAVAPIYLSPHARVDQFRMRAGH